MRVLFVITCLSYGGAEKNLLLVAEHFSEKHTVAICNLNERDTVQKASDSVYCFEMERIRLTGKKGEWIFQRKKQLDFLNRICDSYCPDVIISFLPISNVLAIICGKIKKIPVIISERADPYQRKSRLDKVFHWIYNRAEGAVFQTEGAKSFYSAKLQRRSTVIANPVIIKNNMPIHDNTNADTSIAFVGRFELAQKRHDVMLMAMRKIKESHPEYKLIFWGDGEDEVHIREMVSEMNLDNNVIFAGLSNNVLKDINTCKIFAITSDYEGIPNVLIEAMSIGMPCVATDCSPGGARMLLEDGTCGKLVKCGDWNAFADAVISLIEDDELANSLGMKGKCAISKYSYQNIMNKWDEYLAKFEKGR